MAKKRWSKAVVKKTAKLDGRKSAVSAGKRARRTSRERGMPGRQTDVRPHGAQAMSELNRNGLSPLLIFARPFMLRHEGRARRRGARLDCMGTGTRSFRGKRRAAGSITMRSERLSKKPQITRIDPVDEGPFFRDRHFLLIWIVVKLQFSVKKIFIGLRRVPGVR
ncbi:hypothetical protein [Caballeronia cordobensis]|uniref:hypothetical protein n=1 Tax=Caballeronia cordobensis TaxID=1353886 RepID=UPI0011776412|nr:hypothetical protein [Caballeronia cordobensis]